MRGHRGFCHLKKLNSSGLIRSYRALPNEYIFTAHNAQFSFAELNSPYLFFGHLRPSPEFGVYCSHCRSEVRGTQCAICKGFTFQCAICHVAVRGSSNFCLACGHGGHTSHMMEWFRTQEVCPTGCGCHCLLESTF